MYYIFIEKQKGCPAENRYPLRSKSKVSTRTEENNITNEHTTQEIEPSPNKRPKLELPTLGVLNFFLLLFFVFFFFI